VRREQKSVTIPQVKCILWPGEKGLLGKGGLVGGETGKKGVIRDLKPCEEDLCTSLKESLFCMEGEGGVKGANKEQKGG